MSVCVYDRNDWSSLSYVGRKRRQNVGNRYCQFLFSFFFSFFPRVFVHVFATGHGAVLAMSAEKVVKLLGNGVFTLVHAINH